MSTREYAVITGASSGIGAATARALADNGYHVIAAARRIDKLKELAASNENIEAFELDVTDQVSVDALVAHLGSAPVSILVHSAGGAFDADSVMDSDPALWQKTFDINVVGAVRMVKALTPIFRQHRKGHIVRWVVMLPDHFNVDSMLIKPLAQAVSHKVYRKPIR